MKNTIKEIIQPGLVICTLALLCSTYLISIGINIELMKVWYYGTAFIISAYIGGKTFVMKFLSKNGQHTQEDIRTMSKI